MAISEPTSKKFSLWLVIASLVGMVSSSILLLEKLTFWINKAEGKDTVLDCDINPIVGCGPVINTAPASIFGEIPNPLFGAVLFAALGAIAVILLAGVRLPEWLWGGLQIGVLFGIGVVSYLQYEAIYNIHALCPYCMVVWSTMIPLFWTVTSRNLKTWAPSNKLAAVFYKWTPAWIILHFSVILTLIFTTFGDTLWA